MIEKYTRIAHTILWTAVVVHDNVFAPNEESLLTVLLKVLPELTTLDLLLGVD